DAVLQLTADNAEVSTATAAPPSSSDPALEADPVFLLPRWQDSVVGLWTPSTHASAIIIDARGLVATNQKSIGSATSAEVELTPTVKVAARVLASDMGRDVAILWIDPKTIAAVKPVPLGCAAQKTAPANSQKVYAIGAALRQPKDMTPGTLSDLVIPEGSDGGPVFTAEGTFVGITSTADKSENGRRPAPTAPPPGPLLRVLAPAAASN